MECSRQRRHFSLTCAPNPLLLGDESQRCGTPSEKRHFSLTLPSDVLRLGEVPAEPVRSSRKLLSEGRPMDRSASADRSRVATMATSLDKTSGSPTYVAPHQTSDRLARLLHPDDGGGLVESSADTQNRRKVTQQLQSPGVTSYFGNDPPPPLGKGIRRDENARQTKSIALQYDDSYYAPALTSNKNRPSRRSIVSPRLKESPPWALESGNKQALRSTSLPHPVQTGRKNKCGGSMADGFSQSSPEDARLQALGMDRRGRQSPRASQASSPAIAPWEKGSGKLSRSPSRVYDGLTPPWHCTEDQSSPEVQNVRIQSKRRQSPQSLQAVARSPPPFGLHGDSSPAKISIAGVASEEEMRVWVVSCMNSHVEANRLEANQSSSNATPMPQRKRALTPQARRMSLPQQVVRFDSASPRQGLTSSTPRQRLGAPAGKVPVRSFSGQTLTDSCAMGRSSRASLSVNTSRRSLASTTSLKLGSRCSSVDSLKSEGDRISKGFLSNMAKILGDDVQQEVDIESFRTHGACGPGAEAGIRNRSNSIDTDVLKRKLRAVHGSLDNSTSVSQLRAAMNDKSDRAGSARFLGAQLMQNCAERIEQLKVEYHRKLDAIDMQPHSFDRALSAGTSCAKVQADSETSTDVPTES